MPLLAIGQVLQYVSLAEELIAGGVSLGQKMKDLAHAEGLISETEWSDAKAANDVTLDDQVRALGGEPPEDV